MDSSEAQKAYQDLHGNAAEEPSPTNSTAPGTSNSTSAIGSGSTVTPGKYSKRLSRLSELDRDAHELTARVQRMRSFHDSLITGKVTNYVFEDESSGSQQPQLSAPAGSNTSNAFASPVSSELTPHQQPGRGGGRLRRPSSVISHASAITTSSTLVGSPTSSPTSSSFPFNGKNLEEVNAGPPFATNVEQISSLPSSSSSPESAAGTVNRASPETDAATIPSPTSSTVTFSFAEQSEPDLSLSVTPSSSSRPHGKSFANRYSVSFATGDESKMESRATSSASKKRWSSPAGASPKIGPENTTTSAAPFETRISMDRQGSSGLAPLVSSLAETASRNSKQEKPAPAPQPDKSWPKVRELVLSLEKKKSLGVSIQDVVPGGESETVPVKKEKKSRPLSTPNALKAFLTSSRSSSATSANSTTSTSPSRNLIARPISMPPPASSQAESATLKYSRKEAKSSSGDSASPFSIPPVTRSPSLTSSLLAAASAPPPVATATRALTRDRSLPATPLPVPLATASTPAPDVSLTARSLSVAEISRRLEEQQNGVRAPADGAPVSRTAGSSSVSEGTIAPKVAAVVRSFSAGGGTAAASASSSTTVVVKKKRETSGAGSPKRSESSKKTEKLAFAPTGTVFIPSRTSSLQAEAKSTEIVSSPVAFEAVADVAAKKTSSPSLEPGSLTEPASANEVLAVSPRSSPSQKKSEPTETEACLERSGLAVTAEKSPSESLQATSSETPPQTPPSPKTESEAAEDTNIPSPPLDPFPSTASPSSLPEPADSPVPPLTLPAFGPAVPLSMVVGVGVGVGARAMARSRSLMLMGGAGLQLGDASSVPMLRPQRSASAILGGEKRAGSESVPTHEDIPGAVETSTGYDTATPEEQPASDTGPSSDSVVPPVMSFTEVTEIEPPQVFVTEEVCVEPPAVSVTEVTEVEPPVMCVTEEVCLETVEVPVVEPRELEVKEVMAVEPPPPSVGEASATSESEPDASFTKEEAASIIALDLPIAKEVIAADNVEATNRELPLTASTIPSVSEESTATMQDLRMTEEVTLEPPTLAITEVTSVEPPTLFQMEETTLEPPAILITEEESWEPSALCTTEETVIEPPTLCYTEETIIEPPLVRIMEEECLEAPVLYTTEETLTEPASLCVTEVISVEPPTVCTTVEVSEEPPAVSAAKEPSVTPLTSYITDDITVEEPMLFTTEETCVEPATLSVTEETLVEPSVLCTSEFTVVEPPSVLLTEEATLEPPSEKASEETVVDPPVNRAAAREILPVDFSHQSTSSATLVQEEGNAVVVSQTAEGKEAILTEPSAEPAAESIAEKSLLVESELSQPEIVRDAEESTAKLTTAGEEQAVVTEESCVEPPVVCITEVTVVEAPALFITEETCVVPPSEAIELPMEKITGDQSVDPPDSDVSAGCLANLPVHAPSAATLIDDEHEAAIGSTLDRESKEVPATEPSKASVGQTMVSSSSEPKVMPDMKKSSSELPMSVSQDHAEPPCIPKETPEERPAFCTTEITVVEPPSVFLTEETCLEKPSEETQITLETVTDKPSDLVSAAARELSVRPSDQVSSIGVDEREPARVDTISEVPLREVAAEDVAGLDHSVEIVTEAISSQSPATEAKLPEPVVEHATLESVVHLPTENTREHVVPWYITEETSIEDPACCITEITVIESPIEIVTEETVLGPSSEDAELAVKVVEDSSETLTELDAIEREVPNASSAAATSSLPDNKVEETVILGAGSDPLQSPVTELLSEPTIKSSVQPPVVCARESALPLLGDSSHSTEAMEISDIEDSKSIAAPRAFATESATQASSSHTLVDEQDVDEPQIAEEFGLDAKTSEVDVTSERENEHGVSFPETEEISVEPSVLNSTEITIVEPPVVEENCLLPPEERDLPADLADSVDVLLDSNQNRELTPAPSAVTPKDDEHAFRELLSDVSATSSDEFAEPVVSGKEVKLPATPATTVITKHEIPPAEAAVAPSAKLTEPAPAARTVAPSKTLLMASSIIRNLCLLVFVLHFFFNAGKMATVSAEHALEEFLRHLDPVWIGHLFVIALFGLWAFEALRRASTAKKATAVKKEASSENAGAATQGAGLIPVAAVNASTS
ncbi:hypothetical protein HDU96_006481 [Phlyctochytrium bullatum]|nr:hypothetical protein HDU96_006481 [Phlyctochytrium bullatum]